MGTISTNLRFSRKRRILKLTIENKIKRRILKLKNIPVNYITRNHLGTASNGGKLENEKAK